MNLRDRIRDIPDFPHAGILFRDITPLLQDPTYFRKAVDMMAYELQGVDFDVIAGPESRGFIFGTPLAYVMDKPFVPVRKVGKLPYKTLRAEYDLEYGSAAIEMHIDAIKPGDKVVIVDDLLATGGTAKALCSLIEAMGGTVARMIFLIELDELNGRDDVKGYDVASLLVY